MSIEIRRLTAEDIPGAIECIQKGFADDPYFNWQFDSRTFSKERNAWSLWNRCMWGIDNALVYVARETSAVPNDTEAKGESSAPSSRVIGVAFWLPPHGKSDTMSWIAYYQDWVLKIRQLFTNIRFWGRGGLVVRRYWIWKAGQEKAHSEVWTDPRGYYFCNTIAVLPDHHGKGIGRKLVEVITDQADRKGMSCYLESSKSEPNIKIYERFGFKLAREVDCDDNGVTCKVSHY